MDVIFKFSAITNFVAEVHPNCSVEAVVEIIEDATGETVQTIERAFREQVPRFTNEGSRPLYRVKDGGPFAQTPMDETMSVAYLVSMLTDVTKQFPAIAEMQKKAQDAIDAKNKEVARIEAEKAKKMAESMMREAEEAKRKAREAMIKAGLEPEVDPFEDMPEEFLRETVDEI